MLKRNALKQWIKTKADKLLREGNLLLQKHASRNRAIPTRRFIIMVLHNPALHKETTVVGLLDHELEGQVDSELKNQAVEDEDFDSWFTGHK